jgi:hypothetical protein
MTFISIPNSNNSINQSFIKNEFNLFPSIEKTTLLNSINSNKVFVIPPVMNDEEQPSNIDYDPTPIIYQYREHAMFADIWKNIKTGDIVTNRAAKRSLSYNFDNVNIEKKWISAADEDQHDIFVYLISKKPNLWSYFTRKNVFMDSQAQKCVFKNSMDHSIYSYINNYHEELQCNEHFTSEIDGFIKSENEGNIVYDPVEFKCFETTFCNNDISTLPDKVKGNIGLQCYLSNINNVIIGFNENSSLKLQYLDIPSIIKGSEQQLQKSIKRMNAKTALLVQRYERYS